jgi:hypothetical protein
MLTLTAKPLEDELNMASYSHHDKNFIKAMNLYEHDEIDNNVTLINYDNEVIGYIQYNKIDETESKYIGYVFLDVFFDNDIIKKISSCPDKFNKILKLCCQKSILLKRLSHNLNITFVNKFVISCTNSNVYVMKNNVAHEIIFLYRILQQCKNDAIKYYRYVIPYVKELDLSNLDFTSYFSYYSGNNKDDTIFDNHNIGFVIKHNGYVYLHDIFSIETIYLLSKKQFCDQFLDDILQKEYELFCNINNIDICSTQLNISYYDKGIIGFDHFELYIKKETMHKKIIFLYLFCTLFKSQLETKITDILNNS